MAASAPSSETGHRSTALAWGVLLAAGLACGIWSLSQASMKPEQSTSAAWLDGSAENALNKSLRLPYQSQMETTHAAVRYRAMGNLGSQVSLGCPQWLFYQDGLRPQPGVVASVFDQRMQLMQRWSAEMQRKGVRVLVVAVPDKARIEAQHLCGKTMASSLAGRFDQLQQSLAQAKIPFVDLRPVLAQQSAPMFFQTDVHMNAAGAQKAAQAVAQQALALHLTKRGAQEFEVSNPAPAEPRMGDLIVLSGLQNASDGWRPRIESVPEQTVTPQRSGGLLDETPPVQVLLAGSSNGKRSNFAEWLGAELGQEVWNRSMDGGQFSGAMQKALSQQTSWPKSLELVIWEFSENSLSLPLTTEEKLALQEKGH